MHTILNPTHHWTNFIYSGALEISRHISRTQGTRPVNRDVRTRRGKVRAQIEWFFCTNRPVAVSQVNTVLIASELSRAVQPSFDSFQFMCLMG